MYIYRRRHVFVGFPLKDLAVAVGQIVPWIEDLSLLARADRNNGHK